MPAEPLVTVHVPGPLRRYCGGDARLQVAATSVREALDSLERCHPDLYRCVCDERGAIRRHVNLFVNRDHIRDRGGLAAPLVPGDVVTLFPAVSGG